MDASRNRPPGYGSRHVGAALSVAALLGSCGARTELAVTARDAGATDAAADAGPDVAADAPRDAPPDAAPRCRELVTLVPRTPLLTTPRGSYVTPRVVARGDGFDVLGPLSNPEAPLGIRARHFTVRGAPPTLAISETGTVGPGSFTWAEAATDGTRLGVCFAGSTTLGGPQCMFFAGAYEWRASTSLNGVLPAGVGSCRGLAWAGDRWVSAWARADDGPPGPQVVALDAEVPRSRPARPALVGTDRGTAVVTAYGRGAAWALPRSGGVDVVFAPRGAAERPVRVAMPGQALQLAAWPPDPSALAAVWADASRSVWLAAIREDGAIPIVGVAIPASPGPRRSTVVAAFGDGVVVASAVCGAAPSEPGRVDVHRLGADGRQQGRTVSLPLSCEAAATIASVAASATQIAVTWMEPRPGAGGGTDVVGAVLGCAP